MSEVAIRPAGNALAMTGEDEFWSEKQLAVLRQLGVESASNADLAVFHHVCQRTGLDPFARQIYLIKRAGKQTIQTGIDGLRLVARRAVERTNETLSISAPQWCGKDGVWRDVWLDDESPAAAAVTVQRGAGQFPAVALWREYVQHDSSGKVTAMWRQRPAGQLAKCAEALALRKAFPQDLAGVYSSDEIGEHGHERPTERRVTAAEILNGEEPVVGEVVEDAEIVTEDSTNLPTNPESSVTDAQLTKLGATFTDIGWRDRDDRIRATSTIVGRPVTSSKELTKVEASLLIDTLDKVAAEPDPSTALAELLEAVAE